MSDDHLAATPSSERRGRVATSDLVRLTGAVLCCAVVLVDTDIRLPDWTPFNVLTLALVPIVIRYGMVVESGAGDLRISTAPSLLFGASLDEPTSYLAMWAVVVLASHLGFTGVRPGLGRGSVEVISGAVMVGVAGSVDTALWPVDRIAVGVATYSACVIALELLRARSGDLRRVFTGVRRLDAALVFVGLFLACLVVALGRRAYDDNPTPATAVITSGLLLTFVGAQILLAQYQTHARGIEVLTRASAAMPWPAGQVNTMLTDFVRDALRAREVRFTDEPALRPDLSVKVRDEEHLWMRRQRGDHPFRAGDRRLASALVVMAEVSRLQSLQDAQLRHQANTDDLTGLSTYGHLRVLTDRWGDRRDRGKHLLAIFLDLDGFKGLNTRLGHLESDEVLRTLGGRFQALCDDTTRICRFGGDEFVALALCADDAESRVVVDRIRNAITEPMAIADQLLLISASLGVATSSNPTETVDDLIQRAEVRMRAEKRDQHATEATPSREVLDRLLQDDGLTVLLQPIVSTTTAELEGVEALVRVAERTYQHLSPLLLVDAAVSADLLDELTEIVLRQAVAAVCEIDRLLGTAITLTVNIELSQLREHSALLAVAADLVRDHGVSLALELSERDSSDWSEEHGRVAAALREAGIGLVIDDFGAGYATYTVLNRWAWDVVKIDRSIVVASEPKEQRLLAHVAHLLNDLGFSAIAEGVEDEGQWDTVADLGIEWVQGWAAAPALSADDLLAHLAQRRNFP